jgi:WD40 repeat protein/transcriptional regulator with XRE-family HTH domain
MRGGRLRALDTSRAPESFRNLLLRYRGRTGLIQRELATRTGVSRSSIQDWEAGLSHPTAERLQALIQALLNADGLTVGRETAEARELWTEVQREAPRMHTSFDEVWFDSLLATHARASRPPAVPPAPAPAPAPGDTLAAHTEPSVLQRAEDWGEAPDTLDFVDRTEELALLKGWVLEERSQLVAILGIGGIGKTSLAGKLAQAVAASFERVYWRNLRNAPPLSEWLPGAIGFLSDQQRVPPTTEAERFSALLQLLRQRRCLLVLDNSEALFEPGQLESRYRDGMSSYGHLLQIVCEAAHQSCLILTSREAPPELAVLAGSVRTLQLAGLGAHDAQTLLAPQKLNGTSDQWVELNALYGGNSLALKVVGETIREVLAGDIAMFLNETGESSVLGGLRRVLAEQVERSSALEQQVLRMLAVDREPTGVAQILAELGPSVGRGLVLEAIEALRRRSLVERAEVAGPAAFTLQSVVLEFVTERLVEVVADEIQRGRPVLLNEQPLIRAQAKDYVRQAQERLIGAPIVQHVKTLHGERETDHLLLTLLDAWRGRPTAHQGYGPGNVVNLLRVLRGDLRGLDFSRLALRQAYLAQVDAQDARLVDAHLAETVLAEAFDFPGSVALSGDSALLAAGTHTGQVWLWRVADRTPLWAVQGHTGPVRGVALSADGRLLASGGGDGRVQLWETGTGRALAPPRGNAGGVRGVALSADGRLLSSASEDGTAQVWETGTGRPVATLQAHAGGVWGVALSAGGDLLASAGGDGNVRLWETDIMRPVATLHAHSGAARGVALSADGRLVASGGGDGTAQLWETGTGRRVASLRGHTGGLWGVALSADGRLVASGGEDRAVRLWDADTGRPVATLLGHSGTLYSVALSGDGQLLASGAFDGTVRLWETGARRPVATLQGHTAMAFSVALSADGQLLVSSGQDGTVRLWETVTGRPIATLLGHTGAVRGVALAADGRLLASGGGDGTVRLWEAGTGRRVATLQGHTGGVWGVALSADGHLLASGGGEGTVRLWETGTRQPVATLHGHTGTVRGVALSSDGQLLVTSGQDGTVRLWDTGARRPLATLQGDTGGAFSVALSADRRLVASGFGEGTVELWDAGTQRPLARLRAHTGGVWGVALSADGRLLASAGGDGTVRLWETGTGRPVATLEGHIGGADNVALSADGQLVASGGFDGTVRLWETRNGAALGILRPERRYERMDITGLTGVTVAQRAALRSLGAIETHAPPG